MSKSQVNFRLPDELIAALKDRAESEGITSTELATRLLEAGLGLPSPESKSDDSRIEERIATHLAPLQEQLEKRIEERIGNALSPIQSQLIQLNQSVEGRIMAQLTTHLAPLQGQVLELSQCIADHISTQLAPIQEQLERRIEDRIHTVIQNEVDVALGEFHAARAESNSQAEMKGLRSQLESRESERDKLSEHLHDQARKAEEWYEKAQELEQELKDLRSHLVTAEREAIADSREEVATGEELSELLEPLPDKIDNGGWLSLKEAYKLAQEHGYAGSKTGFMQLRDATFRKLGFEVDRSRRIFGGNQNSRWLRPFDPT
jgi:chromosome segregation ATPase